MESHVSHNNDRKYYRIAIDTAKEGDQIFNLTEYFKGRVGDRNYGLQMTWYEQGSLKNVKGLKPYIRGNVGHYSIGDDGEIIMAPDAAVVSYVGDPSDADVAGRVVYHFPEQMFPQEGIFYGFIGLIDDSDGDQRLSGVNVWFKVLAGVAYMGKASAYYINEIDKLIHNSEERIRQLLDQGQKDVDAKQAALQAIVDDYKAKISDLIERLNAQGQTTNSMMETVKAGLSALETKIQQDGLFTQAEAEAFKQVFEQEFDQLRQNTVNVYDTENDLMQSSLDSGMKARTLGCTSLNDGLGALYKIVDEQPDNGYSLKLANGKYAMLVAVDAFRKAHMAYQAGQVGKLSDQRTLGTTNLVTNSGITVSRTTKGSGQDATAVSITANSQDPTSAVGGINTQKLLSYGNLDSVALYVANATDNPHITIEKGTYSTTKNTFVLNEDINGINPGMYIALTDAAVTHAKLKVSDIVYLAQVLKVDGRTLTVDGYYSKDQADPLDAGPSPSTYTAYINPITKRWAINPVVEIGADDRPSGSAVEGNVKNHNTSDAPDDLGVFDAVNLKEGKANYAFRAHTNSYSNPFDNGVDLTNTLNLLKGNGTPQSFTNIITTERTDKDIPYVMRYDGAVSYEALIPTTEQDANWASFQVQDEGTSFTLANLHNGQYLTLAIGAAGNFSLLADKNNIQTIEYNDANTPYNGPKMTFMRSGGGYMLFRIFGYQNRAYIMSMTNGKFISAEGT